jgi:fatty-acid peroxygenase
MTPDDRLVELPTRRHPMPREPLDGTVALLSAPYEFISRRCERFGTNVFAARIFLRNTICLTGRAAAELFYDTQRFERQGGAPEPVRATLFGKRGIQSLDGEEHLHRKRMFLSLTSGMRALEMRDCAVQACREAARHWVKSRKFALYDEMQPILTRAVCTWAGVPLLPADVRKRSTEITAMFDSAGAKGPRHLWSRLARWRCERWAERVITDIRQGRCAVPARGAAATIAFYRDLEGNTLPPRVAATELLNVLRPTVAIAVYCVLAAHALYMHPLWRERLRAGDDACAESFVQEVRRFYPFFPAVVARVKSPFEWRGYRFPRKWRAMLDLHGINHDPRLWDAPDEFRPQRFATWKPDPFGFVPQGGGYSNTGHRCPGEAITVEVMKGFLAFLISDIEYEVPRQDLRITKTRMPALPKDRFVIENVRIKSAESHHEEISPDGPEEIGRT